MQRRTFTLAGIFGAISAAIGEAFRRAETPRQSKIMPEGLNKFIDQTTGVGNQHTIKVGRKIMRSNGIGWDVYADIPENFKRWNDVSGATIEPYDTHDAACQQDIIEILKAHKRPDFTNAAIETRQRLSKLPMPPWCNGHNGPSPLSAMHVMSDGRQLCVYCYNQEINHGLQLEGSDRGQAPSA